MIKSSYEGALQAAHVRVCCLQAHDVHIRGSVLWLTLKGMLKGTHVKACRLQRSQTPDVQNKDIVS